MIFALHIPEYIDSFEMELRLNPSVLRISKGAAYFCYAAHVVGCIWFLIIDLQREDGSVNPSFIIGGFDPTIHGSFDIFSEPTHSQYFRGPFWAFATMTGYGETEPNTNGELIFTTLVMLMGVAFFVTVVGLVEFFFETMDSGSAYFRHKIESINGYMKYRRLPPNLQRSVRNYYSYLWNSRRGLDESELLKELPPYLRTELVFEVNREIIDSVEFF